jgi:hypothetical protein
MFVSLLALFIVWPSQNFSCPERTLVCLACVDLGNFSPLIKQIDNDAPFEAAFWMCICSVAASNFL